MLLDMARVEEHGCPRKQRGQGRAAQWGCLRSDDESAVYMAYSMEHQSWKGLRTKLTAIR